MENLNLLTLNNTATLQALDWDQLVSLWGRYAHFPQTKRKLSNAPKYHNKNQLEEIYHELSEFLENHENEDLFFKNTLISTIPQEHQIPRDLSYLEKDGILSLEDLHPLAKLIEVCLKLELKSKEQSLKNLEKDFLNELRLILSPEGEVFFDRHPWFIEINQQLSQVESDIRQAIRKLESQESWAKALQFKGLDIKYDKFTVAINADYYQAHFGRIIDHSETKKTFFIEPHSIQKLNQKRSELFSEQQNLLYKISKHFSEKLRPHIFFLKFLFLEVSKLDFLIAKGVFHREYNLCFPQVSPVKKLELQDFFHPLIENPIPNTVELHHEKGLILSGPNTGGKTVCIKSILLSQILLQKGLGVNAKTAILFPFKGLFYFSHDGQNLKEGLSSFAAESKTYLELLQQLENENLICFDEIFNSTSSEEASALATSFFEVILKKSNSYILASTHHHMLKVLHHQKNDFLSAHVLLHPSNHKPSYKLFFGSPGSSHAISIFQTSYTSTDAKFISERAKDLMDNKNLQYESLIHELSNKKHHLEQLIREQKETNQQLFNQKSAVQGELKIKQEIELKKFRKKLDTTFNKAHQLLNKVKQGDISSHKKIEKESHHILQELPQETPIPQGKLDAYKNLNKPDSFKRDESYFCINLGKNIILKDFNLPKNMATIKHKNFTLQVPLSSLRKKPASSDKNLVKVHIESTSESNSSLVFDARGMRLDEFQSEIEVRLQGLHHGTLPYIDIIHGHGTGALKAWLRSHLKQNKESFQWEVPKEGLDGITRVFSS